MSATDLVGQPPLAYALLSARDSLTVIAPPPAVPAFPADWHALFQPDAFYVGLGDSARTEEPAPARVFVASELTSQYTAGGGISPCAGVAQPRFTSRESVAVGTTAFGVLFVFFLLFALQRRHHYIYTKRHMNSRFFNVASIRTAETAPAFTNSFGTFTDIVWSLLIGFLAWRGLWLQCFLRESDGVALFGLLVCAVGGLLLTAVRYSILTVAERLSGCKYLRWCIWENGQVAIRAMWPLLLVGATLSVYIEPGFQWYMLLATLGMAFLGWGLRIYRVAVAFRWHNYGWLYFFLYLCGVEILLPMIIVRLATDYLSII